MALFDTDLFKPYLPSQKKPAGTYLPTTIQPKITPAVTPATPGMEDLMKSEEETTQQPSYADRTKTQDGDQTISEFLASTPKWSDLQAAAAYHVGRQHTGAPVAAPFAIDTEIENMPSGEIDLTQAVSTIIYDEHGYPIATGYEYEGIFYLDKNLVGTAEGLYNLVNLAFPTWGEYKETTPYQDVTESTAWGGLQDLMGQVGSEDWVNQMTTGGLGRAEQVMGLQPGTYGERAGGLAEMMGGGIGGMQGLTEQESQAYDRQKMQDIQQLREETKLALEALGASGRGIQAFTKADEISSQIGNVQLQYELKKMELNVARKQAEYDAANKQYEYMVDTGQMSVDKYTAVVYQQVGMQLQNYATEVGMIESANTQYLRDYQTELSSFVAHTEAMYQAILLPLQIDQQLYDNMSKAYEAMLAPWYRKMEELAIQIQQDAIAAAQNQSVIDSILGFLGIGISAITGIGGLV